MVLSHVWEDEGGGEGCHILLRNIGNSEAPFSNRHDQKIKNNRDLFFHDPFCQFQRIFIDFRALWNPISSSRNRLYNSVRLTTREYGSLCSDEL